jgi:hypothetical protein
MKYRDYKSFILNYFTQSISIFENINQVELENLPNTKTTDEKVKFYKFE